MLSFFSNELFLGAAGMASIIALIALFWQAFSNNKKRLYYQRTSASLVKESPSPAIQQQVVIDGKTSSKLNVDTFVLLNKSKKAITEKDFLSLPSWDIGVGTQLYSFIALEGSNGASASWENRDGQIEVTGLRMPRDGAVGIAAFHDGSISNSVNATPMEISDLKQKALTSRKSIWTVKSVVTSFEGSIALFGIGYVITGIWLSSTQIELISISMAQYTSLGITAFLAILLAALMIQLGKHMFGTSLNPNNATLEATNITETALRSLERKTSE